MAQSLWHECEKEFGLIANAGGFSFSKRILALFVI